MLCSSIFVVDGDTVKCDGLSLRDMGDGRPFISGYDAPEIYSPSCEKEYELGMRAKARMEELIAQNEIVIVDSGQRDMTDSRRRLVSMQLQDGTALGTILIKEGLARPWHKNYRADWCQQSKPQRSIFETLIDWLR
jgi:endonuclease YncB( thermonuclease family)